MKYSARFLIAALVLALSLPALAQDTLIYQCSILNAARQPVNASYPIVFSLYVEREGGEYIWSESYDSVDIVDGTCNVDVGSVTPFPSRLGENAELYLGVAVNDAPEMTPRVKVSSALRARWAAHAKDVRGEDIHPNSVSINDSEVINSDGQWVGDPTDYVVLKVNREPKVSLVYQLLERLDRLVQVSTYGLIPITMALRIGLKSLATDTMKQCASGCR